MKRIKERHYITYVKWEHVLKWKDDQIKSGKMKRKEHLKPYAFGVSKKYIFNEIEGPRKDKTAKNILWIFSIPIFETHSSLPTLVAKIVIDVVVDRVDEKYVAYRELIPSYIEKMWISGHKQKNWRYVVLGIKDESQYYPINQIYKELKLAVEVKSRNKVPGKNDKSSNSFFSNHFRTIKRISITAGRKFNSFSSNIEKRGLVFISYRRGRGSRIVRDVVEELCRKNVVCWFDKNRIPQDEEQRSDHLGFFYNEMFSSITDSSVFVALKREDHFDSPWTLLEYCLATHENGIRRESENPLEIEEENINNLRDKEKRNQFIRKVMKAYGKNTT